MEMNNTERETSLNLLNFLRKRLMHYVKCLPDLKRLKSKPQLTITLRLAISK